MFGDGDIERLRESIEGTILENLKGLYNIASKVSTFKYLFVPICTYLYLFVPFCTFLYFYNFL